ncbi:hypothetical protein [Glaciecola punicea]|uniref:hypothetical protein n=1 Tax=Glaciecola punicea TaxID=56804 RepID=UPI0013051533|nr:hypothetical protein [Glaciecola punicea]
MTKSILEITMACISLHIVIFLSFFFYALFVNVFIVNVVDRVAHINALIERLKK